MNLADTVKNKTTPTKSFAKLAEWLYLGTWEIGDWEDLLDIRKGGDWDEKFTKPSIFFQNTGFG